MVRIVASEWVSLDGVIQAPGASKEDTSGGFSHGGWHVPYFDDLSGEWVVDGLNQADGFLLGRCTYDILSAYWPHAPEEELLLAEPLNGKPKYVASSTLREPLGWDNAYLLEGELVDAVRRLRSGGNGEVHLLGSSRLLHLLEEHGLVDEYRLMIDPLALGAGKRLFSEDGSLRRLELVDSRVTTTGAILARYLRIG